MTGIQPDTDPPDAPLKGVFYLICGVTIFSTQDVLVKYLSGQYSVFEILFFRSIFSILPALAIVHFDSGLASLKTSRLGAHVLRSFMFLLAYTFYYLGIAALPLADAVALFFTSPIFVTLFSIILLHERVTSNRWAALLAGFTGVMIILRPGTGMVAPASFLSISAAISYATAAPLTRQMADTESGSVMAFYAVLFFTLSALVMGLMIGDGRFDTGSHASANFFCRAWVFPPRFDLVLMAVMGLISSCARYCMSQAYRLAKSSTVTPFEYIGMIPTMLWGYVFWHEIPSATTLIGMSFLVLSGIYIIRLERHCVAA
jgi:drug/metabolite transporter (DMT)-like permease